MNNKPICAIFCTFAVNISTNMENSYIKQFPELMAGKTVLYCHGFGSSGQSGTVTRLREVMPNAKVIAPDLPVDPHEAIALLHTICEQEKPDLIIGTSMGGMYAEQLRGFDRICINPALEIAETMRAHGMTGTQQYQNPRLDGVQEFYVDKALVKAYREVSEQRFVGLTPEDERRVYGLFGDKDDLVDTIGIFSLHYSQATNFHGEHRMDDKSYMHSVLPVIRWIDDKQEHRQRPIRDDDGCLPETGVFCSKSSSLVDRALRGILCGSTFSLCHDNVVAHGTYQRSCLAAHHLHATA